MSQLQISSIQQRRKLLHPQNLLQQNPPSINNPHFQLSDNEECPSPLKKRGKNKQKLTIQPPASIEKNINTNSQEISVPQNNNINNYDSNENDECPSPLKKRKSKKKSPLIQKNPIGTPKKYAMDTDQNCIQDNQNNINDDYDECPSPLKRPKNKTRMSKLVLQNSNKHKNNSVENRGTLENVFDHQKIILSNIQKQQSIEEDNNKTSLEKLNKDLDNTYYDNYDNFQNSKDTNATLNLSEKQDNYSNNMQNNSEEINQILDQMSDKNINRFSIDINLGYSSNFSCETSNNAYSKKSQQNYKQQFLKIEQKKECDITEFEHRIYEWLDQQKIRWEVPSVKEDFFSGNRAKVFQHFQSDSSSDDEIFKSEPTILLKRGSTQKKSLILNTCNFIRYNELQKNCEREC